MIDNNHLLCKRLDLWRLTILCVWVLSWAPWLAGWESPHPCFLMMKSTKGQPSTFQELSHVCRGKWHGHLSGNQRRVPARIWLDSAVSQMVLGRLNPSEEGNKCKFNFWGLFEVHLHLNECDRTWNDPFWKSPLTAMKGVERDKHWWQWLKSWRLVHGVCFWVFTRGWAWMCASCVRHAQTARIIEFVFLKPFECEYTMENNLSGPVPGWQGPVWLVFCWLAFMPFISYTTYFTVLLHSSKYQGPSLKNKNMWLLLQRGMNNSIPCATTSKVPRAKGLNEGRPSCSPILTWLPLINPRSRTDT